MKRAVAAKKDTAELMRIARGEGMRTLAEAALAAAAAGELSLDEALRVASS